VRPYPLTVLNGGINRLRIKGGASASNLYDLTNAYITNSGAIVPREGTINFKTLDSSTIGLAAANGTFNIFSTLSTTSIAAGFTLNVLQDPTNPSATLQKIWFAKPFMGFEYVVAQFSDGLTFHYWLQNSGTWTTGADYTTASIVLPIVLNGLAYQAVRHFPIQPLWTPDTVITSASYVEPNTPTGFAYQAIAVAGSPAHTGAIEPIWPVVAGGIVQEFGDFDVSSTDAGTTQSPYTTGASLSPTITDRYGDSATISNAGTFATGSTLSTLTLASTKVLTWTAGTAKPPGSVVVPTTNQGAFINAIPNGDLESGAVDWTFTDVGGVAAWSIGTGRPYQGTYDLEIAPNTLGADGAYATMTTGLAIKPGTSVTLTGQLDPNNTGANLNLWLVLRWYDATSTFISNTLSAAYQGGGYRPATVTGTAPANAAFVKAAVRAGSGGGWTNNAYADLLSWNLETPATITNFLFEAVQPNPGITSATEPTWPTVLGNTVIDGTVTWEAIGTSIIKWQAIPLMQAGVNVPVFTTGISTSVYDSSTYENQNGYITTFTSMSWEAVSREVSDPKNPQTAAVTIGASHVFAGDNDIVDFSAAVNPIDWSSTNNAGYLPTGLNNYGDNPVTALALYRGNLIVFNAGGYQMWQIDPDPQNMAFLDAQPVGCIWTRSCQSVANDLIFLTEVGVRNLGTIGATANMAIGNTGQPVDPLIVAQFSTATLASTIGGANVIIGTTADPYWTSTVVLLHFDGVNGQTVTTDSGPLNLPITNAGAGILTSATEAFGPTSALLTTTTMSGFKYPASGSVLAASPANLSTGDFTVEGWFNLSTLSGASTPLLACLGVSGGWELRENSVSAASTIFQGTVSTDGTHFTQVYGPDLGLNTQASNIWHHVALVRSGGTLAVATDGVFGTNTFLTGILGTVSAPLYFGFPTGAAIPAGFMDEVRITTAARYSPGTNFTISTTTAFDTNYSTTYDPLTIYYPGRGQYWLIFGPQVFVLTINGLQGTKSWSRYIFPQSITDATLNSGSLFLRTSGNIVLQLMPTANTDASIEATNILSTIQWPYLDMGGLGLNKMLIGVDLVGDGSTTLQIAYDQQDKSTFSDNPAFAISTGVTAPYFIAIDDTVPGEPLPIPINAPSYSLILTFDGGTITTPNNWTWEAANFYLAPQGGGGVTG
jgi:hypothetical protein